MKGQSSGLDFKGGENMLNRRLFIKGLIGTSITFCHGSVFAGIRDIKDIPENIIVIEGKKYVAAPIYTPEEARAAFSSALAEWPSVRDAINRLAEKISRLNVIDEHRMWVEESYMSNEIESLYAEWEKRHGIIYHYMRNHSKLLAWTKDGELIGPPYGFDDSAKEEDASAGDDNRQNISIGESGKYIVKIDGVRYFSAPTHTPEKAQAAFSAALAELPYLRKEREKIINIINKLEEFGGLRMTAEVRLLNCKFSRLVNGVLDRHGLVQIYSDDDTEFRLAAWTEKGMVTGPVFRWYQEV